AGRLLVGVLDGLGIVDVIGGVLHAALRGRVVGVLRRRPVGRGGIVPAGEEAAAGEQQSWSGQEHAPAGEESGGGAELASGRHEALSSEEDGLATVPFGHAITGSCPAAGPGGARTVRDSVRA